jgi:hypothetical protein
MGKDMEMSCDEMVVEKMLRAEKNGSRDILKVNKDISIFNLSAFRFVNLQQYDTQGNETDGTAGTYTDGKNSVSDMKNHAGAVSNVSDNKASGNVGDNSDLSGEIVSDKAGTQNPYSNQSNADLYTENTMLNAISDKGIPDKNESGQNVSYAKSHRVMHPPLRALSQYSVHSILLPAAYCLHRQYFSDWHCMRQAQPYTLVLPLPS